MGQRASIDIVRLDRGGVGSGSKHTDTVEVRQGWGREQTLI